MLWFKHPTLDIQFDGIMGDLRLLEVVPEICLSLDQTHCLHLGIVAGAVAWPLEAHVALDHDGLLGPLLVLHHHVVIEHCPPGSG